MSPNKAKPFSQLQKMAILLGWQSPLRIYHHHVAGPNIPSCPQDSLITWYISGRMVGDRNDCFLQINESPQGQTITYEGAVYAIRYRICTGWHNFSISPSADKLKREANRLAMWLAWDWFSNIEKRRLFRQTHPECTGISWRTI